MPHGYFSYTRVSTVRQGQTGTSLIEQREAIQRYAQRWNLQVIKEYEEKETAAKQGRPVFIQMLRALKHGMARGVIIHKIDRSARNLRDWAELGDLIDIGIEVHFANENLDLYSRGGRLSADIQAVVAADYIRNLREEVKKGFYGRIKQGFYPMPAPIGYVDMGKAKPKESDPVQGQLVRQAFELYATGRFSLYSLTEKMYALGLRNKAGHKVKTNTLARMLHNPFYTGLIRIKVKGEMFNGQHQPIVPSLLFEQVQAILKGKNVDQKRAHSFIFRRLLYCGSCQAKLIGELQKRRIYYRCHTRTCPQKTIREDEVEGAIICLFKQLHFTDPESRELRHEIKQRYRRVTEVREAGIRSCQLQLEQTRNRLSALTDAYIDGAVDKEIYLEKKNSLVVQEKEAQVRLASIQQGAEKILERVEKFLELVNNAYLSYKLATPEEKRELVQIVTSNLTVEGKSLSIKLNYPFQVVFERQKLSGGGPQRQPTRMLSALLNQLQTYFAAHDLSTPMQTTNNESSSP